MNWSLRLFKGTSRTIMVIFEVIWRRVKRALLQPIYAIIVWSQCESAVAMPRVNGPSSVTKNTVLGNNVHINGLHVRGQGRVSIGDNFHSGKGLLILTQNHNYATGERLPYDSSHEVKDTTIGDNVWIGLNVTLLPGVTLGEGCIIQAGSVVCSDIPRLAIAGGHPARVFSERDKSHYDRLKFEERFF